MRQVIPAHLIPAFQDITLVIQVCCFDDGSTDSSWDILTRLQKEYHTQKLETDTTTPDQKDTNIPIDATLLIAKSKDGTGRGAGYARNRAAELSGKHATNEQNPANRFLCLLDSDDLMHETRVAEQCSALLALPPQERHRTLLGCQIVRDPPDSTWHYCQWANGLTDERLWLEKFREVTVLQPTWMLCMSRFQELRGYIEPDQSSTTSSSTNNILRLVHPTFDTPESLRLAEDLRFFHAHLHARGLLRLHRPDVPLVTYRHRANQSQSSQTSRKLLLHLRALAFEKCVLSNYQSDNAWSTNNPHKGSFVVWGAGRDGKDFVKALSEPCRKRVYCFVDVDSKKIEQGFYVNKNLKIPIVHFSLLAKDAETQRQLLQGVSFGKIDKGKPKDVPERKKHKSDVNKQQSGSVETPMAMSPAVAKVVDVSCFPELPVVVCVALYRTNGALENNVKSISREEGVDLWHFN
eukprot:Sro1220_g253490.2  (464) ;mRNA; f:3160-4551